MILCKSTKSLPAEGNKDDDKETLDSWTESHDR